MKGEMYMLIDKVEMLHMANMYLNYMLHAGERAGVEAVDFRQRRFGMEKKTFFEIRIKPKREDNEGASIDKADEGISG